MAITQAQIAAMFAAAFPVSPWFPSICQLLRHDGTKTADGQLDTNSSHWVSIRAGTDAIPCRKVPLIIQRVSANEGVHPDQSEVKEAFEVGLNGPFPNDIKYADRVVIDGEPWQIDAREEPGNAIYTRFRIQRINL